jgi:hypothetical protein
VIEVVINLERIELALRRVKIIRHNVSRLNMPDDPSYPYKLHAILKHPDFHGAAMAIMFRGPEELVVRAKSERGIRWVIRRMKLQGNDRLLELTLTSPGGTMDMLRG